jgi:hypothetical protein
MNSRQTIENKKGNQTMSHNNTVFSQLLKLIPRHEFETLAKQHHSGRSFRTATRWSQFVTMVMGQLAARNSLRDIIENMSAQTHRLYHLGSAKLSRINEDKPTHCMRHYLENCCIVARQSHRGIIFASITCFILWMHQRLICVYRLFHGRISERPRQQ